jgi:hypothetical protein
MWKYFMQKFGIIFGIYFLTSKCDFVVYRRLQETLKIRKFFPLFSLYQQIRKRRPLFNLSNRTPLSSSRERVVISLGLCVGFDVLGFELRDIGHT